MPYLDAYSNLDRGIPVNRREGKLLTYDGTKHLHNFRPTQFWAGKNKVSIRCLLLLGIQVESSPKLE